MFEYFIHLLCVYLLTTIAYIYSYKHCCHIMVKSLICTGCIPIDVPDDISTVEVFAIEFANYAGRSNFQGLKWHSVQRLAIIPDENANGSNVEVTHKRFTPKYKTFVNLTNLVSLRFSSVRMMKMERGAFDGLSKLETLDLRDCLDASLVDITTGIEGSNLPNLRTLILKNTSQLTTLVSSYDERFFNALSLTRLEHIDFSYTRYSVMDSERFSRAFPYLQSLNFEHGGYLAVNFLATCFDFGNGSTFTNLRKININFPIIPEAVLTPANEDILRESSFAHNFTEVRVRGCTPVSSGLSAKIFGTRLNSSVHIGLEFVGTGVKWNTFNLLVDDKDAVALETFDIGENCVESVDKSITSYAKYLKRFDIAVNRFFKMDGTAFEVMLYNMTELEIFNCSHNALKRIPKNLFKYSGKLKVIDMSYNLIENLIIKITHLLDLEILDLSNNKIQFLSSEVINNYEFIFTKINTKLNIKIGNNPFECSCRSKDFVHWLSSVGRDSVFYNEHGFVCHLGKEKEIPVNDDAVSEVEYLCIRPYVITSVSLGAGLFVFVVVAIFVYCVRRHKEKKRKVRLRQCIELFKLDRNLNRRSKKCPVFLSYSSSDADIVDTHVLYALNENLQRLLETEDRCVATGDMCFTPGFHVTEEMAYCLESCSVLVACISKNFCKSIFCKEELLAANHDKMPMILLFLENVDVKQLPKSIQRHFRTTTRAKLTVTNNGGATFTPDIKTICEGIAKLMNIKMKVQDENETRAL